MAVLTFRMPVLILAAYMLAVILPVLAAGDGRPQSQADHAQMMAMAGHPAQMPMADGPDDMSLQLACQQHCLFAAAAFPAPHRVAETVARSTVVKVGNDMHAASLAIPPPGPPPKFAVI